MNRTPPIEVRRQLRREVRFCCPVPGCNNPYLEWHHFDPPWHILEHHNPEGMIALCSRHHPQADANAFTDEQLRRFKSMATESNGCVKEQFQWLRNRLLAYLGGNHYLDAEIILKYKGSHVIWFTRDELNHMLLNLNFKATTIHPRLVMEENFWLAHGNQEDLDCPPSGKLVHAKYPNGDEIRIEFCELKDQQRIRKRYPKAHQKVYEIDTPITTVEVKCRIADTVLDFEPQYSQIDYMQTRGNFFEHAKIVFNIN